MKSCAQTFPPIFGLFAIFDRNFPKLVAPPSGKNENDVVRWKSNPFWKNAGNRVEISL